MQAKLRSKLRADLREAFGIGEALTERVPADILSLILAYAYDVRCGACTASYWFWIHETKPKKKSKKKI
jgi:hypothetical protein